MRPTRLLFFLLMLIVVSCESDMSSFSESGQAGSMTRFAINNNYLYIVDHAAINVFDIADGTFTKVNRVDVDFGLETIFARGEYLYLGANDAMYIFGIAEPENPTFIFRYDHIVSCDPVVVQDNRAYVTLRSGTACNLGVNALEIIDITNPNNPTLITNYPMTSPGGLGVDGNLLFICEGEIGLTVLDISNEHSPKVLTQLSNIYAHDVIARNGIMIITGEDGIFQYHYSEEGSVSLLSKIPVTRTEQ